ncbi:hypothetical protein BPMI_04652 [Candidatus Burkholderia pumila]|uniref:Uncharacterized protein n=1 Tax=Candidatus Burkholderia pumila TaxID=1090375 RepID=A0ABR5HMJ6_9BURK|nr:hypothetical protein BPMI_04652 [Candidatus Burkholderia pumila]
MGEGIFAIVTASDRPRLREFRRARGQARGLAALLGHRKFRACGWVGRALPSIRIRSTASFAPSPMAGPMRPSSNSRSPITPNAYRGALTITGVLSTKPIPFRLLMASREPILLGIVNRAIAAPLPPQLEAIRSRWI